MIGCDSDAHVILPRVQLRHVSGCGVRLCFENLCEFPEPIGDFRYRDVPADLSVPPLNEWLPETCPAHGEADKTRRGGSRPQPEANLQLVLTTPENDATDL